MRVCILWPALQEPPAWLTEEYDMVRWNFCLRQRVFLNFTNQRRPYQEQALTVWRAHRPLSSGFELSLPVPSNSESAGSGSGAPAFGYVLCLCAARGAAAGSAGGPGRAASIAAQLMHSKNSNPATATLQQIYTNVDEGVLDPSTLDATAARDLLSRVLLAGDDELLLMLVEAGMGSALGPVCLQQILQYAMLEELPSLAQLVVQSTEVELTHEVLHWLVPHLLFSGNTAHAEVLLGRYCITRRNPLSAVAAIKEAIMKVVSASKAMTQQQDMFKLAVKFRAAQYSLVQELLQEHAGWEPEHLRRSSMKALNLCDVPVAPLLQRLQQSAAATTASAYTVASGSAAAASHEACAGHVGRLPA
uniref:Uncharacterized protein n=1 Tax=Tetradesmus obliquus TaxID=3088 RepID=A0A383VLG3_TETOB|eukprot:jgi/Sobl393_1/4144/SZX65534.1